jgi:hypothetical protein
VRVSDDGAALVARKLTEHFAPSDRERARDVLADVDLPRVQLAAIKLSDGDIGSLERYVLLAHIDWRDVVGPAESRQYLAAGSAARDRPDVDDLVESDRIAYERWLESSGPYADM